MRSGESSIEQRPDTRICVVRRISDGMKECEGDGCQRKSEAVEKEYRTLGGQTDMDGLSLFTNLKARRSSLYSILCSTGSQ